MSRRRKKQIKGKLISDTLYGDRVLSKFINIVMVNGMKSKSEKIVYDALDAAANKLKAKSPIDVFRNALSNVKPGIEGAITKSWWSNISSSCRNQK